MTITGFEINSPSPYFVLSKHDTIPTVLTVSNSREVENDIKVFTTHKTHSFSSITSLKAGEEVIPVPESLINQHIDLSKVDVIKTGDLSIHSIKNLAKKLNQSETQLVSNGTILLADNFDALVNDLGKYINILVLDVTKLDVCFSSIEDTILFSRGLTADKGIENILLTNFAKEDKFTNILYQASKDKVLTFQNNTKFESISISTLTASISANIANDYPLAFAIYGALEFTQNATLLSQDDMSSSLNLIHNVYVPLSDMVNDDCFTAHDLVTKPQLIEDKSITHQFMEYLNEHPYVEKHWNDYVNHDFVKQVAESRLDLQQFKFYIEQDYNYLADYARFHCISAAKAPDLIDIEKELYVLDRIRESMDCHKNRLRDYFGVTDDDHMNKVERSDALNEYARYMGDISRRGNYRELMMALCPCMIGYCKAVSFYVGKTDPEPGSIYRDWTNFYSSIPIEESIGKGAYFLNHVAQDCPKEELYILIKIYGDVCGLEAKFWDSPLERTFT